MPAFRALLLCGAFLLSIGPAPAADPAAHGYSVTMANMSYGRLPTGLKVGDTISWVNRDTVPHTVTARDHSFDLRVAPGQTATMTLGKAGSFPFFCTLHTMMRGTLVVK